MGSSFAFAAAYAALTIQSAAGPAEPLKPSSPWNVEYADNMCLLGRDFGEGEKKVTLGLKPGPASDFARIIIVTRNDSKKVTYGDAQLEFDGQAPVKDYFIAGPIAAKPMRMTMIDLKRSDLATLPSTTQLTIRAGEVQVALTPTHIGDAMRALADCETNLLVSWGMDPVVLKTIVQFPTISRKGGDAAFFSSNDYPLEALSRGEQGTVGARVHVGANGRVTECRVIETSGSPSLDNQTCGIIRSRYRYEPARDQAGQSVPSFTYSRINWEIAQ